MRRMYLNGFGYMFFERGRFRTLDNIEKDHRDILSQTSPPGLASVVHVDRPSPRRNRT